MEIKLNEEEMKRVYDAIDMLVGIERRANEGDSEAAWVSEYAWEIINEVISERVSEEIAKPAPFMCQTHMCGECGGCKAANITDLLGKAQRTLALTIRELSNEAKSHQDTRAELMRRLKKAEYEAKWFREGVEEVIASRSGGNFAPLLPKLRALLEGGR